MNSQGNDVPGSPDPGNYTIGRRITSYYRNNILEMRVREPIQAMGESGVRYEMEKIQDEILAGQSTINVQRDVREWDDIPDISKEDLEEAIRIMDTYQLPPPVVPTPPPTTEKAWDA